MSQIWAIACKDLRLIARDRSGLFFVLFFPIIFAVFFGSMYAGDDGRSIPMAVHDADETAVSQSFRQALAEDPAIEVVDLSQEEAQDAVRAGTIAGLIRIPEGFGAQLERMGRGPPPVLRLVVDPTRRAEIAMLEGVLTRDALESLGSEQIAPMTIEIEGLESSSDTVMPEPFELSFPQGIVWGLLSVVMSFSTSLVNEKTTGTLLRLRVAPLSSRDVLAGKAIACFLLSLLVCGILLAVGAAVFGIRPVSWPLLSLGLLCVSYCMTGMMLLLATFGNNERSSSNIGWSIMMLFAMLGGGMIPLVFMADWMVSASQVSPIMWSVMVVEGGLWRGFILQDMIQPCGILLACGTVCFLLGTLRFRRSL